MMQVNYLHFRSVYKEQLMSPIQFYGRLQVLQFTWKSNASQQIRALVVYRNNPRSQPEKYTIKLFNIKFKYHLLCVFE